MAREATKVEFLGFNRDAEPRSYIVASSAAIAKGCFLKIGDGRVATASAGTGDSFAGFAAMEKENDDYSTTISAWTNCIVDCTASTAVTAGDLLQTAAPGNYVMPIAANTSSQAIIVGVALDSVAAAARVNVRVNI